MAVVTTSMGCKDTAYVNVNVHQGPIADFNAFHGQQDYLNLKLNFLTHRLVQLLGMELW